MVVDALPECVFFSSQYAPRPAEIFPSLSGKCAISSILRVPDNELLFFLFTRILKSVNLWQY